MEFDQSVTIGNVLDNCQGMKNRQWTTFETKLKRKFVQFTADIPIRGEMLTEQYGYHGSHLDRLRNFADNYLPVFKFTIQFQMLNNNQFKVTHVGMTLEKNLLLDDFIEKERLNKHYEEDGNIGIATAMKLIYQDKPLVPYGILHELNRLHEDEIQRRMYKRKNEVESTLKLIDYPKKYRQLILNVYENQSTGAVLAASFRYGIIAGAALNGETGATCSFFEDGKYNEAQTEFVLTNATCSPSIKVIEKRASESPRTIAISDIGECGFCGMGISMEGEYQFIGVVNIKDRPGTPYINMEFQ
ncbi:MULTISPECIES: hypothetical protein [unclassified Maridesulfovibrio]|uniref:hypothetical protein n=1 Tax=unclassified Maridesulfovibrio TaxID=2794999 RepID=UPI003B4116C3